MMDYQEALEKHEKDCRRCRERICKYAIKKFSCLQEIDIKAYEELMSYRRIGTLEEFKELKERDELSGVELAKISCNLNHLEKYKQIGTLDEVREAMEKQRKKRPEEERIVYTHEAETLSYHCPCCKFRFINKDDTGFCSGTMTRYCPVCGQKIDWGE